MSRRSTRRLVQTDQVIFERGAAPPQAPLKATDLVNALLDLQRRRREIQWQRLERRWRRAGINNRNTPQSRFQVRG